MNKEMFSASFDGLNQVEPVVIDNLAHSSDPNDSFENMEFPKLDSKNLRVKTSLRMTYQAEVEVLKRQLGDLESMRKSLGLSQRKMCQLLMVDPSAWTRWVKARSAPPHIYRALHWYLLLNEKYPWNLHQHWLGDSSRDQQVEKVHNELASVAGGWERSMDEMKSSMKNSAQSFEDHVFGLKSHVVSLESKIVLLRRRQKWLWAGFAVAGLLAILLRAR